MQSKSIDAEVAALIEAQSKIDWDARFRDSLNALSVSYNASNGVMMLCKRQANLSDKHPPRMHETIDALKAWGSLVSHDSPLVTKELAGSYGHALNLATAYMDDICMWLRGNGQSSCADKLEAEHNALRSIVANYDSTEHPKELERSVGQSCDSLVRNLDRVARIVKVDRGPVCPIRLDGNIVFIGTKKKKLTKAQAVVLKVLANAWPERVLLSDLQTRTGKEQPDIILKRLREKKDWNMLIASPEGKKGMGYGIR